MKSSSSQHTWAQILQTLCHIISCFELLLTVCHIIFVSSCLFTTFPSHSRVQPLWFPHESSAWLEINRWVLCDGIKLSTFCFQTTMTIKDDGIIPIMRTWELGINQLDPYQPVMDWRWTTLPKRLHVATPSTVPSATLANGPSFPCWSPWRLCLFQPRAWTRFKTWMRQMTQASIRLLHHNSNHLLLLMVQPLRH